MITGESRRADYGKGSTIMPVAGKTRLPYGTRVR